MALDQNEFSFPDETSNSSEEVEIVLEDDKEAEVNEPEVEIVDDTPEEDRGRKAAEPPEEVSEEELEQYSEKVKKRIQKFSRGYHDERRAKEAAARERDEAVRLTQSILAENQRLKSQFDSTREIASSQAKSLLEEESRKARDALKSAYEAGDVDALADAQERIADIRFKSRQLETEEARFKQKLARDAENEVYSNQPAPVAVDPKAQSWQDKNQWFGQDDEMTAFALGLHQKLIKEGVSPNSSEYYERIDRRMRQVFSDQFESEQDEEVVVKPKPKSSVVAPATRSTGKKTIRLTKSQVSLANRLGVPLDVYAQQVAMEERKQNV